MGNSEKTKTVKMIYDDGNDLKNGASMPRPKPTESIIKPTKSSPDKGGK
ncbi:MAG: hypothetical protein H6Q16_2116 [Bacteroidetes bacterium]|nr:hypothetical protein [Bacteroidota bacterium]